MRDIVSTIQPEQDEIVRSDLATSICVQGAPGTGKTAVGLHRAAWLLYAFRSQLERSGVLVVGPNHAFLDHISAVLPSLGELRVRHSTIDALLDHGRVRATDSAEVAKLKGDARLAEVLRRAVWSQVRRAEDPLVVPRGSRRWRVARLDIQDEVDALVTRGVRYSAARELLPQRLAHRVLLQMERSGDSPDDRVQDSVARSTPVTACVRSLWPVLDPAGVLFRLLSDAAALAEAADGILTGDEQRSLLWTEAPRTKGAARWSRADMALLDELADLLARTPSTRPRRPRRGAGPLADAAAGRRAAVRPRGRSRCSATSRRERPRGPPSPGTTRCTTWDGQPHERVVLDRGFRVPSLVIEFAARLLPHMAPGIGAPASVRGDPGRLTIVPTGAAGRLQAVADAVRAAVREPGSVGVIAVDTGIARLSAGLAAAGVPHGRLDADAR